jgi:hypothetical protein
MTEFPDSKLRRRNVILVIEERICWRVVAECAQASTKKLNVEENLSQGVHKLKFQLSVEGSI